VVTVTIGAGGTGVTGGGLSGNTGGSTTLGGGATLTLAGGGGGGAFSTGLDGACGGADLVPQVKAVAEVAGSAAMAEMRSRIIQRRHGFLAEMVPREALEVLQPRWSGRFWRQRLQGNWRRRRWLRLGPGSGGGGTGGSSGGSSALRQLRIVERAAVVRGTPVSPVLRQRLHANNYWAP